MGLDGEVVIALGTHNPMVLSSNPSPVNSLCDCKNVSSLLKLFI